MKIKNLIVLLFTVTIVTVNANDKLPYKIAQKKAIEVVHQFHKMMKINMGQRLKKGGTLEAAKFCIKNSAKEIKKFNKALEQGVSLKRVSLRNRNPNAYPTKEEIKILKAFELLENSSVYLPNFTQVAGENKYKVYFAATMSQRSCKKCHGLKKSINSKVLKILDAKYPNDKALGFRAGEVRGAVIVTVNLNN